MGKMACEAFLGGKQTKDREGAKWQPVEKVLRDYIKQIWVSYAPGYSLQDPSEIVTLYRVLFKAAEDAGLNPKFNPNVKMFEWET